MGNIRIHKEINLLPIQMRKENLVNVFYGLIEKYNLQQEYCHLTMSKQEIWALSGLKGEYNSIKLMEIIKELTKPVTFSDGRSKINGSIFVTEEFENGTFKIYASEPYRPFLFLKKDIELMTKAKQNKILTVTELDYWDRIGSKKSKFLVLLKKADILGISGKYNKRLYALLMQFKQTQKYIACWDDFKEILEIPISYKSNDIDKQILKKVRKELLKVNLKITKINKIKKGISISRIEICFKIIEPKIKNITSEKIEDQKPDKIIFTEKEYYDYADYLKKNNEKDTKFQRESFRLLQKLKV